MYCRAKTGQGHTSGGLPVVVVSPPPLRFVADFAPIDAPCSEVVDSCFSVPSIVTDMNVGVVDREDSPECQCWPEVGRWSLDSASGSLLASSETVKRYPVEDAT
jgi:hypothetical protein